MKALIICVFFYLMFFFISCSFSHNREIERILEFSGKNKGELETVLKHYSYDIEKLDAACFLIKNMIGKQILKDSSIVTVQPYFDALEKYRDIHKSYGVDGQFVVCDSIRRLYPQERFNAQFVPDIKNISSKFLIKHIDYSFKVWKESAWSKNISFDIFCRYILPYTTENCYWEQSDSLFYDKYRALKDTISLLSYSEIGEIISTDIDNSFKQNWLLFARKYPFLLPTSFYNLAKAQIGTCLEANIYKIAALRATGIPAVLNTIPCWGNSSSPHFWTEIVNKDITRELYNNKQRPFISEKDILVSEVFWNMKNILSYDGIPPHIPIQHTRTIPKVYRINYQIQEKNLAIQAKEPIPDFFKNPGLEDVTDQYIKWVNVDISIWNLPNNKSEYVYLCCYDSFSWIPVCWSTVKNGKAFFEKMGVNTLYLPAYYKNGVIVPAGNVFILTEYGKRRELLITSGTSKEKMNLYTKNPYRTHSIDQARSMIGGRFQLANSIDLSDTTTVYTINKIPFYEEVFKLSHRCEYRYLICEFQNIHPFYISEIQIYGKNSNDEIVSLSAKVLGNKGTMDHTIEKISDNDRVSYFQNDKNELQQHIVFDLGKPTQIAQVKFYPRSDDNRIVSGELYELFYWNSEWKSLGKQIGVNNHLAYFDIPQNILLRIHNHTRGVEHRPFTYEDGKQIWW